MTNPKTTESRAGKPEQAIARSTSDGPSATADPVPVTKPEQNLALDQLVQLTKSISDLARRSTGATLTDQEAAEQARVVFAYDFLGVVLGRRKPSVFQLTTVTVVRVDGRLTFTGLGIATAAKIRAANNVGRTLENLSDGVPVRIDDGVNAITDDQRIDSIVTFTELGGVPVAIGPCLDPIDDFVTG